MKSLLSILACAGLWTTSALHAQTQLDPVLQNYLGIKNELVEGNGKNAAQQADTFLQALDAVQTTSWSSAQVKTWQKNLATMKAKAKLIKDTTDITQQRAQLNDLSVALYNVFLDIKPGDQPIFYEYCPMKQAYWLSEEKAIRNPYYGAQMLTCGRVEATLN